MDGRGDSSSHYSQGCGLLLNGSTVTADTYTLNLSGLPAYSMVLFQVDEEAGPWHADNGSGTLKVVAGSSNQTTSYTNYDNPYSCSRDYSANFGKWFVNSGSSLSITLSAESMTSRCGYFVPEVTVAVYQPTVMVSGGGNTSEASATPKTFNVSCDTPWYQTPDPGDEALPSFTVPLSTSGSTATAGSDYTGSIPASVTFDTAHQAYAYTVTPKKDNLVEGGETVILAASSGSSYSLGTTSTATVLIADDPPVVSVTKVQDGSEDPDSAGSVTTPKPVKFNVTRTGGDLTTAISVTYQVAGNTSNPASTSDYSGGAAVSVTNQGSLVLGVTDDEEIEYREGLLLTLTGSGTAYTFGPPATTQASAEIKDNDFSIKATAISFDSQGVGQDTGTQPDYGSTQWSDTDGDSVSEIHGANENTPNDGYPVSYRRSIPGTSRFIHATNTMTIEYKDPNVLGATFGIFGTGSGPGGGLFSGTSGVGTPVQQNGASRVAISGTYTSQTALPSTIDDGELSIEWTLYRSVPTAGAPKIILKSRISKNHIYVTGYEGTVAFFETVLDLACKGAKGKRPHQAGDTPTSTEDANGNGVLNAGEDANGNGKLDISYSQDAEIASGVWSKFSGRDVKRVDGTPMTYWGANSGPSAINNDAMFKAFGLLKNADGRCNAWADLFVNVLRATGVSSHVVGVTLNGTTLTLPPQADDTPPANRVGDPLPVMDVDKPAQNSEDPWRYFPNHALVRIDGITGLYDPSYGGTPYLGANAEQAWEDAAISGFCYEYQVTSSGVSTLGVGTAYVAKVTGVRNTFIGQ